MAQLPPGFSRVFSLHDVEGYAHAEIAQRLRISEGTSKSQLHKSRLRLRDLLRRGGSRSPQTADGRMSRNAAPKAHVARSVLKIRSLLLSPKNGSLRKTFTNGRLEVHRSVGADYGAPPGKDKFSYGEVSYGKSKCA